VKLHPLTAVRDALLYGVQAGSFGFFASAMGGMTEMVPMRAAFVLAPLGFALGAAYGVARYTAFEYELGETTLAIRSGVFQRQAREIPLGRVQNVDVEQSLLQRLLGLAEVRFETAGGGATEGKLSMVDVDDADRLQADLRQRRRAARQGGADGEASEPEPSVLYELSLGDLLVLAGVSFRWGVVPLTLFSYPFVDDLLVGLFRRYVVEAMLGGTLSPSDPRLLGVGLALLAGYATLAWLLSAAVTVLQYYGFRLARLDDQLVYERGLVQRYSGTIPLEKVQSVAVEENAAMRRLGYAALTVETAGYAQGGGGGDGGERSPSAIPLADRGTVLGLVAAIEGVENVAVDRPPERARRRYAGRYALVVAGLAAALAAVHLLVRPLGVLWALPVVALAGALPGAHLKWANRGYHAGDRHFLARTGFWRRSTRVVPYYRLQTVVTERTVFQRRWGLASVVGDTAASSTLLSRSATAHDLDDREADALHDRLREGLVADLIDRRTVGRRSRVERLRDGEG
jgi:putative membrane protein